MNNNEILEDIIYNYEDFNRIIQIDPSIKTKYLDFYFNLVLTKYIYNYSNYSGGIIKFKFTKLPLPIYIGKNFTICIIYHSNYFIINQIHK